MLPTTAPRLRSVDALRGATIVAMILVNAQFSPEASYRHLRHAAWHGWTFADTIYPCFLFLVGVSLTLSTAARTARGEGQVQLMRHALQRSLLLFACGVAIDLQRFPARAFPFIGIHEQIQLTGVLQQIAIGYLAAFMIYLKTGLRGVICAIVGLNLMYLGLLFLYPVPGCGAGSLIPSCNFARHLDETALGGFSLLGMPFDPNNLSTIIPITSSVLLGVAAGQLLQGGHGRQQQVFWLVGAGIALIVAGKWLSAWVPINKHLWTTSFVLLTAGLSAVWLAGSIRLLEDGSAHPWSRCLEMLGRNAVAAYLVSRLVQHVPRVHVSGRSLYADVLERMANPQTASLLFALLVLAAVYVVIWLMDRRGWILKF